MVKDELNTWATSQWIETKNCALHVGGGGASDGSHGVLAANGLRQVVAVAV